MTSSLPDRNSHWLIKDEADGHVIDGAIGLTQLEDRTWWREAGTYTIERTS